MFRFALLLLPAWLAAAAPAPASPSAGMVTSPEAPFAPSQAPSVQGLRGDYYNGLNFDAKVFSRVDRRIDFHWAMGDRPGPGIDQEAFSVRWTGKLYAPVEGTYNFIVNTDNGVRLWVDGRLLIADWNVYSFTEFRKEIRLAAGRYYDLKVEYNNHKGPAVFRVAWEHPMEGTATSGLPHYLPEDVIPAKYLFTQPPPGETAVATAATVTPSRNDNPSGGGNGLLGEYFRGDYFGEKVFSRIDRKIDFRWEGGPGPDIHETDFSVRWTGKLLAPADGKYKFMVNINDGARLWIGGKLVLDEWRLEAGRQYQTEIELQGGRYYDIKLEYFNGPQLGIMQLSWESPENRISLFGLELYASPEIIPSKYLFSLSLPPPSKPALAKATPPARKTAPAQARPPVAKKIQTPARKPPATAGIPVSLSGNVAEKRGDREAEEAIVPSETPREETARTVAPKPAATTFEALEPGKAVVLEQVHFEQSQYRLLPQSYAQLDKLANTLLKYPQLTIEVAGHTDNVGDARLNQALSEHRALVVTHYLQRKGVAEGRIRARGYGGSRPVAPNTTETERARNRRVEFTVDTKLNADRRRIRIHRMKG
jgi:outer membrane protein OmpA-like peptidoglycan-associated protein